MTISLILKALNDCGSKKPKHKATVSEIASRVASKWL